MGKVVESVEEYARLSHEIERVVRKRDESHDRLIALEHRIGEREEALSELEASDGRSALRRLLADEEAHVCCWAAVHLISEDPERAVATLERLTTGAGMAGFNARFALREWRAGRLN